MMKKKLLALVLVAFFAVGCGGSGGDDGVDRLSKKDYVAQIEDKFKEMASLQSETYSAKDQTARNEVNNKVRVIVDEMIALNGPENLADKEKKVDDALTSFNKLIESAKTIGNDPNKASTYMTDLMKIVRELQDALTAYQSA